MAARTVVALLLVHSLPSCAFQPFAARFQGRSFRPCGAGSTPPCALHCARPPAHSRLHATAGQGDAVAERIRLLWELEDAVQAKDFVKAQELQGSLRTALALDEDELLPIGKEAFKGKEILVAGANGRLGAQVVRELLRRGCSVRATVRNTDDVLAFERLSYQIGAEEGLADIQAPWVRKSIEMQGTAQMAAYGLGRCTVLECDLMDEQSVAKALVGSRKVPVKRAARRDVMSRSEAAV
jgi:hypothetical protein